MELELLRLVLFCFLLLVASFRFAWTQDAHDQAQGDKAEPIADTDADGQAKETKAEPIAGALTRADLKAAYANLKGTDSDKQKFRSEWAKQQLSDWP